MKAIINVNQIKALKAGLNNCGVYVMDFDPAELSQEQRDELSMKMTFMRECRGLDEAQNVFVVNEHIDPPEVLVGTDDVIAPTVEEMKRVLDIRIKNRAKYEKDKIEFKSKLKEFAELTFNKFLELADNDPDLLTTYTIRYNGDPGELYCKTKDEYLSVFKNDINLSDHFIYSDYSVRNIFIEDRSKIYYKTWDLVDFYDKEFKKTLADKYQLREKLEDGYKELIKLNKDKIDAIINKAQVFAEQKTRESVENSLKSKLPQIDVMLSRLEAHKVNQRAIAEFVNNLHTHALNIIEPRHARDSIIERFNDNVLDEGELHGAIKNILFHTDKPYLRYNRIKPSKFCCDPMNHDYEFIVFEKKTLTEHEYDTIKKFKELFPNYKVTPMIHRGECGECETSVEGYSVKVEVEWNGLTLKREFEF